MVTSESRGRLRQLLKAGMGKTKAINQVMREYGLNKDGVGQGFIRDKKDLEKEANIVKMEGK